MPSDTLKQDRDGTISVKQGKVVIKDPQGLGRYPRIKPGEYIELYIKDELVKNEIVVNENIQSEITIKLKETKAEKKYNLELSADMMKAYLEIKLSPELDLVVPDYEPATRLIISGRIENKKLPSITTSDIVNFLNEKGIVYGIIQENIIALANNPGKGKVLIAEGDKYVEGKNARVETTTTYKKHEMKKYHNIESFVPGDIVAYKKKAVAGKAGINVKGKRIKPPSVKDIVMKAGKGIRLTADGFKAIAEKSGRVNIDRYNNSVKVSIVEQYIVKGDVDKNTGNINYRGDLIVTGSVSDYFDLQVGHDIQVGGSIANADINSGGNLKVRNNIIGSKINLGNYLEYSIVTKLKDVNQQLKQILLALEQIIGEIEKRRTGIKGFCPGKILRLLIVNKFEELPDKIQKLYQILKEENRGNIRDEFNKIIKYINNPILLEKLDNEVIFKKFTSFLDDLIERQSRNDHHLNIVTGYIQNSSIRVLGNVVITRKGCINSNIAARGSIVVNINNGFLRGGKYSAGNIIYSYEIGSKLSITTLKIGKWVYAKK